MSILETLNSEQKQAASVIDGPLLILAGAGSGKTRTITTRLAYLVELGIPASQILTLTFTNKAANEMRSRALAMIPNVMETPLLCTFHRFGLLFLRMYIHLLNRANNFIIIDSSDRKKILRDILSNFECDLTNGQIPNEISRFKNANMTPQLLREQCIEQGSAMEETLEVYEAYETYLNANNLVDFDDLLLLSYQILYSNPDIAQKISEQYRYVMVDEYQDTNEIQNKFLDCLLSTHQNICVVGDDDQAIYGWRGANVDYILNFPHRFKDTKIIRLEGNYRSTTQIIDAANRLIAHNNNRLGKTMISYCGDGKKVEVMKSLADYTEINSIALKISNLLKDGAKPTEIAILFRLNAFSRSIEEGLMRAGIPFRLLGTLRFYERREVKNYLAYFRFLINFDDNFSLNAIIDHPKRGIGKISLQKILLRMKELNIHNIESFSQTDDIYEILGQKRARTIQDFVMTLRHLRELLRNSIHEFLDSFEHYIPLKNYYAQFEDGNERVANIDELFGVIRSKVHDNPDISLEEILNEFSLYSEIDDTAFEHILCMSIHNSKGLEFDHVFVVGLEEGFFPLLKTGNHIEEERRLGYVAFTRAKKTLTLSYVENRYFHGKESHLRPSRFLAEAKLITGIDITQENTQFAKGDLVRHSVFGIGRIELVLDNPNTKLRINFGGLTRDLLATSVIKIL